jgi:hypothetical protein
MPLAESIREFLEELRERFKKPEPVEEPLEWGAEDVEPVATAKPPEPEAWGKKRGAGSWPSLRLRVFNLASTLFLVLNVAATFFFAFAPQAVALIAVAYLVPNTLLLIHYRKLLGKAKMESR